MIMTFYSKPILSQNLVPNPGFEDTVSCPIGSDISYAVGWYTPTFYSPDYFNSCAFSSGPGDGFSVPNNWYGTQNAKTGQGYAGIITGCFGTDCREYIQTQLLDTLMVGKKYCVSFWVCFADTTAYAVNDVGVYFSAIPVGSGDNLVLPFSPQIQNYPLSNPLSSRNIWIQVTDTLFAQGDELYITIGNFKNDQDSDTSSVSGGASWNYPYYYIDDVSVIDCDSLNGINSIQKNYNFFIYPNPTGGWIEILSEKFYNQTELIITNITGQIFLHEERVFFSAKEKINLQELPNGVYILTIRSGNKTSNNKIIKY